MRYLRHLHSRNLPKAGTSGQAPPTRGEYDDAFDRVAAALGELYLVDDGDHGIKGAPISMSRYFDPCRFINIIVDRQAWHPDVLRILHEQLQLLPEGWLFGIDAWEFPGRGAQLVVARDGTAHGWSHYAARDTLGAFGFPELEGWWRHALFWLADAIDRWRSRREIAGLKKTALPLGELLEQVRRREEEKEKGAR